ncbi:MAG: hypothetical protein AABY22_04920 [Nanoarchaeota archaeon]
MKTTFKCPICEKEIDVGEFGKMSNGDKKYEYRLSNKRFHMRQHKRVKQIEKLIKKRKKQLGEAEKLLKDEESWLK